MNDTLENKYICQYCGKVLKRLCDLTKHTKSVHLGYKYTTNSGGCFQKVKCEKCGNYFLKPNFKRHYNSCKGNSIKGYIKNPKTSKYIKNKLFICECGNIFKNGIQLGSHFGSCNIHRAILGKSPKKSRKGIKQNISLERRIESHIKAIKTLKERIKLGLIVYKGRKHTQADKDKIRLGTIKYLQKNPNFHGPRYNKKACEYIDELNKKNNWNLIHALNGKEECIFGYFVDGYDKNLNIVFEYDEPKHYEDVYNNILKEKDLFRQKQIIDKTNCTFYRYNEKLDLLYKVN